MAEEKSLSAEDIATATFIALTQLIRALDPETRKRFALYLAQRLEVSEVTPLIPSTGYDLSNAHYILSMFVEIAQQPE